MEDGILTDSEVNGTIVYPLSDETGLLIHSMLDTRLYQIYEALIGALHMDDATIIALTPYIEPADGGSGNCIRVIDDVLYATSSDDGGITVGVTDGYATILSSDQDVLTVDDQILYVNENGATL